MAGGEADIWVCGQCRSVNNLRAKQCYHCRTPQHLAAVDPAAIEGTGHGQLREIALPEFHASRGEAMLASLLILLVAGMNVISTVVNTQVLLALAKDPEAAAAGLTADLLSAGSIVLATIGLALLALTAWAFWLSRAVAAMPALGLGYPAANATMAFVENFLPGLNLLRVPPIVRDVIRRLEPVEGSRGDALIFAAWIGLFGGFLLPRIAGWLNWEQDLELAVRNALVIQGISTGLVLVGAVFLVALIWWIEARIALRRAEQLAGDAGQTASEMSAQPAARPAAAPASEPRQSTPVGTPTPFDPMAAPFAPARVTAAPPAATAPAVPFAPTPGPAAAAVPEMVPGPLGVVSASPATATDAFHRPITAVTGAASIPTPAARPADEQPDVEGSTDARPARPAPAEVLPPAEQARPPPVPTGPKLHLRVDSGTRMIATLDGVSEGISLDELRAAAQALARADGSVVIAAATSFEARSLAEQVSKVFADAQVPTTTED
jgi:hypothetical protein